MRNAPAPPRAFFAALPTPTWIESAVQRFVGVGLVQELGETMFPPENWHQSFSERIFRPTAKQLDALSEVGASISTNACTLTFNRIEGPDLNAGNVHCILRAKGRPTAFSAVHEEVQRRLIQAGFDEIATGATPHMTLSYEARKSFDNIPLNPPIPWTILDLCLVVGGGDPYRYEVIGRWPLLPELDPPVTQPGLF